MKKLKLFSLLMLLFVGVTSMWATTSTLTLSSSNKFGTSSGSTRKSSDNVITWTATTTAGAIQNTYSSSDNYDGQQFGTGSAAWTGTFTTSSISTKKITSVVIVANTGGSATLNVSVGSSTYTTANQSVVKKANQTGNTYTFSGSASGNITITVSNTNKAFYLKSIAVNYEAEAPKPGVSFDPTEIAFGNVKLGESKAAQEFTILGENLTSTALTATSSNTSVFTVAVKEGDSLTPDEGEVLANIVVTPITTAYGDYNETITINGGGLGEDTAVVAVSMHVGGIVTVSPASPNLDFGNVPKDATAADYAKTITVSATNLTANKQIRIISPLNFQSYPTDIYADANGVIEATEVKLMPITDRDAGSYGSDDAKYSVTCTGTAEFESIEIGAPTMTIVACTTLDKPSNVVVSGKAYPYNAVALAWDEVENADSYEVYIYQGETLIDADEVNTEAYTIGETLAAATTYSYQIIAKSEDAAYCESAVTSDDFTTEDLPAAVLTLSENGETRTWGEGLKITSEIALPTAVAAGQEVAGKVLVGYTNEANKAYSHDTDAPSVLYAPGANYTIADTEDKLYAVYATKTGDAEPVLSQTLEYDTWSYYDNDGDLSTNKTSYRLFGSGAYIESSSFDLSTLTSVTVYGGTFGGTSYNSLTIGDGTNEWKSVTVAGKSETGENTYSGGTALTGTGNLRIAVTAGDGSNNGVRISAIEIYTQTPLSYSAYTTTGAKAPAATVDPTSVNLTAVAANGVVDVTYANVDEDEVAVALFNDAECSEAFDGGWLTAELNGDNDIAYTAQAAVSYANARTAYIKLTAPSPAEGVDPAVVVIPVTQEKKDAVFTSFEELNNSDLPRTNAGTAITITFSNEEIASVSGKSVYLNIADKVMTTSNIQIYGPSNSSWNAGGLISSTTSISGTWKLYSGAMELAISTWEGISYKAPAGLAWSAETGKAYLPAGVKDAVLPELTNPNSLTVTYSSTDPTVATVSNETGHQGEISPLKAGETTIKATFEGNDSYIAKEVSYTLTVYAPASVVVTGDATKKAYEKGETFSFAGLGAKAVYGDEAEYTIPAEQITWAPAPAPAINANGNVEVTATWQELTSAAEVVAVTVNTHAVTLAAVENGSVVLTIKGEVEPLVLPANLAKGTIVAVAATPAKGYVLSTLTAGSADIKESKSFTIGTEDVEVAAAFARPYVAIMGQFNEWSGAANPLAVALDEKTASAAITLTLNENYGYGFKVLCGDNTLSIENGSEWYHLKRTWNSAPVKYISDTSNPIWIEMDMNGDYTFTWDYTDSTLTITYPALPEWEYYVGGSFTDWGTNKVKMTTTDEETWTATFELEANKTGENKYEFKIVEKQLGETWLGLQSAASMVYGNCTDWVIGGGEAAIGLETTKAANYTFTYVPATKKVSVDIPNPSPATGVDNTADETKAVKFLENGQIFILRGDKTYTIDGQLVK